MSVVIRLLRIGKRGAPKYRIVAIDKKRKRNSTPLEIVGSYEPKGSLVTQNERIEYWQKHGALLSLSVRKLLEST